MYICVEGCAHGDLENIYHIIEKHENQMGKKIDLLICCGDFQATRNLEDLACMAVPQKYLEMGSFYKYYSGQLIAPVLTIFIGGNHEASNHLQELAYGGWVAPNIYYLGYAGVIKVNGIRIGGISGIYRDYLYSKGHFEFPPYDESSIRSVYAVRNLEVFRLKQMTSSKIDIMLSHDWPQKIWEHGNRDKKFGFVEGLLRLKPAFKSDMDSGKLGSPPCMELLKVLKPRYWFAAHMHCRFDALVQHNETENTIFVALDKCLPHRNYLEFLEYGETVERDENDQPIIELQYDEEWLTILSLTNKFLNCSSSFTKLPQELNANQSFDNGSSLQKQRWNYTPSQDEIQAVVKRLNNDLTIKQSFMQTKNAFNPEWDKTDFRNLKQPEEICQNYQTKEFCDRLNIDDPLYVSATLKNVKVISIDYNKSNDDAFKDYNDELEKTASNEVQVSQSKKVNPLRLPKPLNEEEIDLDDLDDCDDNEIDCKNSESLSDSVLIQTAETTLVAQTEETHQKLSRPLDDKEEESRENAVKQLTSANKKFKRRNQDIYAVSDD
ncbi:hypothetical protein PVAND_006834 [Polypedilum vanderplanki]|uniref:Lariat debranching enzyme C-terminal domain-containing protein n=1 Tax=Polypedilum vanderplanki TaxID=319348 RepID=A0A9J6C4V4_POLVA|nr:hypothetical protein PVAND_006834 [Polypedilum vanderplanki]